MYKLPLDQIIVPLFEQIVSPRYNNMRSSFNKNEGIHFVFDVRCSNHGYEKDGTTKHPEWERNVNVFIHVVVVAPHDVYLAFSPERNFEKVDIASWENTSNHDSCWSSSGFSKISEQYFNAYSECYDHVPDEHRCAPIAASWFSTMSSVFTQAFRFVRIETERHPTSSYHNTLTKIEPMSVQLVKNLMDYKEHNGRNHSNPTDLVAVSKAVYDLCLSIVSTDKYELVEVENGYNVLLPARRMAVAQEAKPVLRTFDDKFWVSLELIQEGDLS